MELDPLFSDHHDWIDELPHYQRDEINQLLKSGKAPEEVAQLWLTTSGPANTSPFGGERFAAVFYDKLLDEIEQLLCDGRKYSEERKKLLHEIGAGQTFVVGAIATILAVHVGIAAAVIAPAIALILKIIGKMGLSAWCKARKETKAVGGGQVPAPSN